MCSSPKGLQGREVFGAASPFFLPPAVLSLLPSSPQRAVVLLYALLALGFVIFMALTIINTHRGETSTHNRIAPAKREAGTILGEKTSKRNKTSGSFLQCRRCGRRWPKPGCRARGATRQPGTTSRRSSTPSVRNLLLLGVAFPLNPTKIIPSGGMEVAMGLF